MQCKQNSGKSIRSARCLKSCLNFVLHNIIALCPWPIFIGNWMQKLKTLKYCDSYAYFFFNKVVGGCEKYIDNWVALYL